MNILVVNDDGIDALGIQKLAEALADEGDVYVCSPRTQQSASGHGITIGRLVYMESVSFPYAKDAISLEGTPADCVKIGLELYRNKGVEMDMVFSGFNHGRNLGTDTLYSGTVSAAIEAGLCGLPAVAMSISSNLSPHRTPVHFEVAMKLAARLAKSPMISERAENGACKHGIHFIRQSHDILNVNIPDLPSEGIKGVKVCPLSYQAYDEWFQERADEAGRIGYHYSGMPKPVSGENADESDIVANDLGYATITPLHFDLTDRNLLPELRREWDGALL